MALSFQSIRDNGNFLFTSGRPGTYYYRRAELSPREAWNLWQDAQACQQGSWGFPLHLTSSEFERVTAFDPTRPDESRAERIQTLLEEVGRLDWNAQQVRNDSTRYYGGEEELGHVLIMETNPGAHAITSWDEADNPLPVCELERAWEAYRARNTAAAQPAL